MNKLARLPSDKNTEQVVTSTEANSQLTDAQRIDIKLQMEGEIRVKLAKFANELAKASKLRSGK